MSELRALCVFRELGRSGVTVMAFQAPGRLPYAAMLIEILDWRAVPIVNRTGSYVQATSDRVYALEVAGKPNDQGNLVQAFPQPGRCNATSHQIYFGRLHCDNYVQNECLLTP